MAWVFPMSDTILAVLIIAACLSVQGLCFYWLVRDMDKQWRPVIQAYLEARCQQMGTPMRVPPPAEEPAGKLYPPFPDDDVRDIDDVI